MSQIQSLSWRVCSGVNGDRPIERTWSNNMGPESIQEMEPDIGLETSYSVNKRGPHRKQATPSTGLRFRRQGQRESEGAITVCWCLQGYGKYHPAQELALLIFTPGIIFHLSMNGLYSSWVLVSSSDFGIGYLQWTGVIECIHMPVCLRCGIWKGVAFFFIICQIYRFKQTLEMSRKWLIQL